MCQMKLMICRLKIFIPNYILKTCTSVFIILLFCSNVYCNKNIRFQSIQQGLSNKFIRCILKDSYGFMWFGTFNGLCRYDGTNIVVYEHNADYKNSLCHNIINTLIEDADSNIWIGTAEGLNLYNRSLDNFIDVDSIEGNSNHLINKFIIALYTADDGRIWAGTLGNGINIYDQKLKQFIYFSISDKLKVSSDADYISSLFYYKGNIWIGTRAGLYYTEKSLDLLHRIEGNLISDDAYISCIANDKPDGLIVAVQDQGLFSVQFNNQKSFVSTHTLNDRIIGNKKILTIASDNRNKLWFGTENFGLSVFDYCTNVLTQYLSQEGDQGSITSNSIWSLCADNSGRIWIGTFNKGLCLIDKYYDKFLCFQRNYLTNATLSDNDVTGFSENNDGNIWISTDGGGLNLFNPKEHKFFRNIKEGHFPLGLSNNELRCVTYGPGNNLWVSSWSGGIDKIDLSTNKIKNYKLIINGAGDNKIQCIFIDRDNNIWAGTSGSGIFILDKHTDKFIKPVYLPGSAVIPDNAYLSSIMQSSDGVIWVGTYYGLYALKGNFKDGYSCISYYQGNNSNSISSNRVSLVFEDHKKDLWLGTVDKGLVHFDKKADRFSYIQKDDGLSGNMINGILEDDQHNLWVSTNNGITRINLRDTNFTTYDIEDGLVSNEFSLGSYIKTRSGNFLFGSDNGFIMFNPDSILKNPEKPIMLFTKLKINNIEVKPGAYGYSIDTDISLANKIFLNHRQTSFTIEYVGISYTRPGGNNYYYKLEGFDKEWNNAGNKTSVTYTNLNPGSYRFIVKGFNNDGVECDKPAILKIIVKPAIWKTWWAYCLYISAIIVVLLILIRMRIEKIKTDNTLALERIAYEKEHELNQLKVNFFTNISHDIRTPLSLIMAPLESLISSVENTSIKPKLQNVYNNALKLMELVNELMDFRKIEDKKIQLKVSNNELVSFVSEIAGAFKEDAKRRNIDFQIIANEKNIQGWFDTNKISKILFNLLSNAFKYTPNEGAISLLVEKDKDETIDNKPGTISLGKLTISVIDNGRGILPLDLPHIFDQFYKAGNAVDEGTGLGLTLVQSLVGMHKGEISVSSDPGVRTSFVIDLPICREAYLDEEIVDTKTGYIEEKGQKLSENIDTQTNDGSRAGSSEKPQILIVEDNSELRGYLKDELSGNFYVLFAVNGEQGLEVATKETPDLVLTDIMMPIMDGIELCKRLKSDIQTSHIPIIMLTAKATIDEQVEGIEGGADVYITKPFNIRFLIAQIKQLILNRQVLYSAFSREVHIIPGHLAKNRLDEEFLSKIIEYIVNNITDSQIGVESISGYVNLTRGQVYKKIKAITGQTAVEFIRTIRLKQAIKLMETRKYSLAEIAYQTGFTSPSYFTRSFKEQYGKTPSEYLN